MDEQLRIAQRAAIALGRNSPEDINFIRLQMRHDLIGRGQVYRAATLGDESAKIILGQEDIESHITNPALFHRFAEIMGEHYINSNMIPLGLVIQWISDLIKLYLRELEIVRTGHGGRGRLIFQTGVENGQSASRILDIVDRWQKVSTKDEADKEILRLIKVATPLCGTDHDDREGRGISDIFLSYRQRISGFFRQALCNFAQCVICDTIGCNAASSVWFVDRHLDLDADPSMDQPAYAPEHYLLEALLALDELYRVLIPFKFRNKERKLLAKDVNKHLLDHRVKIAQMFADLLLNRTWYRIA